MPIPMEFREPKVIRKPSSNASPANKRNSMKSFPTRKDSRFHTGSDDDEDDGHVLLVDDSPVRDRTPARKMRSRGGTNSIFSDPKEILNKMADEKYRLEIRLSEIDDELAMAEQEEIESDKHDTFKKQSRKKLRSFAFNGMSIHASSNNNTSRSKTLMNTISLIKPLHFLDNEFHHESIYELLYDFILMIIYIKLGNIFINDYSTSGFLVISFIFCNFMSCWFLFNSYITMLHHKDALHRFYYILHIISTLLLVISIENPQFDSFNMKYMVR